MKKNLLFIGAFFFAVASAAVFTAFAAPTEQEKIDKAYNELKDQFLKEQLATCMQTAEAKAIEKYDTEVADAAAGKTTTTTTSKTTTKPTTGGGSTQTTTTTTTTNGKTDPKADGKLGGTTDAKTDGKLGGNTTDAKTEGKLGTKAEETKSKGKLGGK